MSEPVKKAMHDTSTTILGRQAEEKNICATEGEGHSEKDNTQKF